MCRWTPLRETRELREALPLTHWDPLVGPFTPTLPAFLSVLQNPQSLAMDIPWLQWGLPPPPFPLVLRVPPSGSLSQQLAITSVVGGEGPLAGQLQGPQRDLHVLTGA